MSVRFEHIRAEVFRKPWAILPEKLEVIAALVEMRAAGERFSDVEVRERIGAGPRVSVKGPGAVAVIPIHGVISQRMNLMSQISGGTSIEKLQTNFRQALADPNVKAILFDVDSPGGAVDGVPEMSAEIIASRKQKRTVAVANTMAASAAYWLASAASELYVTPSGSVGSVGVYAAHEDLSAAAEADGVKVTLVSAGKYKVDGNPYEPLSESARNDLQAKVDEFYGMFVKSVAKGRGASQEAVREGFGQGRMVLAADAVGAGMADGVATLDEALAKMGAARPAEMMAEAPARPTLAALRRDLDLREQV